MTTKTFEAEVEVGLDEWETGELEAELRRRDAESKPFKYGRLYESLYYALRDKDTDKVMELAGYVVEAETGRMLP